MKTNWKACILAGALLVGISGTAAARDNVSFSLSLGVPAPVYVAPPAPRAYYYEPAPAYYPAPVYYDYYAPAPAVVYYEPRYYRPHRHHRHHRHW
jgi:hypothetical protein